MDTGLTFVIRIFRCAGGTLADVVEDVRNNTCTRFSGAKELWEVVARGSGIRRFRKTHSKN